MVMEKLDSLAPSFSSSEFFENSEDLQEVMMGTDQPNQPTRIVDTDRIMLLEPIESNDMREILMAN